MYALKRDFPHLQFSLNGGIQSVEEVCDVLAHDEQEQQVHGVMIGRAAYNMPWNVLANADSRVFGCDDDPATSRRQVCPLCTLHTVTRLRQHELCDVPMARRNHAHPACLAPLRSYRCRPASAAAGVSSLQ